MKPIHISELQEALFTHFSLAKLTNTLEQRALIEQLKDLDAQTAFDAFFKLTKHDLRVRNINEAMTRFREFYRMERDNIRKFEAPKTAQYSEKDHYYPDGRRHDEWHLFEVVVVPEETKDNLAECEKAKQSYWVSAGSLARASTIFQDLVHYKLITMDKDQFRSSVDAFEKKYREPLMKFVGNNHDEYPVEVNFKEVLDFLEETKINQTQSDEKGFEL
jgi:hypothetical protein